MVTVVDNGRIFTMDLKLWYSTTKTRGGFVAALGTEKEFAAEERPCQEG